uniref:UAS domain-containing protein n=1 Tax=Globodera pallida TaxID=36090 RepID=A0A183CJ98_GLOPA
MALQAARQKGVWLLVNVQEASEFACAVLNRDIWSAETVREVYHDSADGARIRGYYGLTSFPAIFIVDPRTGEEVSGRLKASEPVSFLDSLTSFLDQNPTFEARDRVIRSRASKILALHLRVLRDVPGTAGYAGRLRKTAKHQRINGDF